MIQQHNKGLILTNSPITQPKDTHTFSLNSVIEAVDDNYNIQSEPGNELCADIDVKHATYIGNNEHLVFLDNSIGLLSDCNYTELVEDITLNYPMQSTFSIKRGCDRVVYWNDNINPDRFINIDNLDVHKTDNEFDSNKFRIYNSVEKPCFNLSTINGSLTSGTYAVQIEYVDQDNNILYRSLISQTIRLLENSLGLNITINNLDTNYEYYRLNLIVNENTKKAYRINRLFNINSSSFNFNITDVSDSIELDYTSLLVPIFNIESSGALEQVQDRLVRANVKESVKDYTDYQKFASKIKTNYYIHNDPDIDTHLMPNEVYDQAIVYIHSDYSESPPFHIPGSCDILTTQQGKLEQQLVVTGAKKEFQLIYRVNGEINVFRSVLETDELVVDSFCDGEDVTNISVAFSGLDPVLAGLRTVSNTNNSYTNPLAVDNEGIPNWQNNNTSFQYCTSKGLFGYYQSSSTYINPTNYCEKDYWGVDSCGNQLINTPIRHHLTPSRGQVPSGKIGAEFTEIEYPNSDIIGHYFVYANTKRVEDNGILNKLRTSNRDNVDEQVFIYFDTDNESNYNYFMSPKTLNGQVLNGDLYVHNIQEYTKTTLEERYRANPNIFISTRTLDFANTNYEAVDELITIDNVEFVRPAEVRTKQADKLINLSLNLPLTYLEANLDVIPPVAGTRYSNKLYYASIINNNENLANLNNLQYCRFNECIFTNKSNNKVTGGDAFINNMEVINSTVVNINDGQLDNLIDRLIGLTVSSATIAVGVVTGNLGAAIGGAVDYIKTEFIFYSSILKELRDGRYEQYQNNTNGDFEGANAIGQLFGGEQIFGNELITNFLVDSYVNYQREEVDVDCGDFYEGTTQEDFIAYLETRLIDYDEENDRYQPKAFPCIDLFNYNTDLSLTSFDDKNIPLPFSYNYCSKCLNHNPYKIVFSPRSFKEELSDSYRNLFSEDFITIPANRGEIVALKYKNNQLLVHTTETTFIIKPYPQTIGTNEDNAYIKTDDFFSIPATELLQTDTGYGGLINSDARVNHKYGYFWTDNNTVYQYTNQIKEISQLGIEQWLLSNNLNNSTNLVFDPRFDRTIVCNSNYTLSFNNKFNFWTSFHSYLPTYSFYNNEFYYTVSGGKVYKHLHKDNYHNYYNVQHSFIIEFVKSNLDTEILRTIHWYSTFNKLSNLTYDQAVIYNSCQSTGILDITPVTNVYDNKLGKVEIVDNNHRLSGLFDLSSSDIVTQDIFPIINSDKDFINIIDKNAYELTYLKDKYHYIRLISNTNNRIVHYITKTNTLNSQR